MIICKVVKPLVSTNRIPDFEHKHLQVVLDGSTQKVAVDAVGCIPGDWVICVGSSAAREAAGSKLEEGKQKKRQMGSLLKHTILFFCSTLAVF